MPIPPAASGTRIAKALEFGQPLPQRRVESQWAVRIGLCRAYLRGGGMIVEEPRKGAANHFLFGGNFEIHAVMLLQASLRLD